MSETRPRRVTGAPKKRQAAEEATTQITVVETTNPAGVPYTVEVWVQPEENKRDYAQTLTVPERRAAQYTADLREFEARSSDAERRLAEATADLQASYTEFAEKTTWIGEQIRDEAQAADDLEQAKQEAEWAAERAELDARDGELDKKYGPALWVYLPKVTRSRSTRRGATLHAWWMLHTAKCQHAKEYRNSRPVVSGEELTSPDHWELGAHTVYGRARADMAAKVAKTPRAEFCGSCKPLDLLHEKVPNWRHKEWK